MAYKHGVYAELADEILSNPTTASAAVVYVGASPAHLAKATNKSAYINTPLKISSLKEARKYLGWTQVQTEWRKYNLCQVIDRHFNAGDDIAPIYVINVFDPVIGAADVTSTVTFANRLYTISNSPDIIVSTIAIAGYTLGTDYTVTASETTNKIIIRDLTSTGIPSGTSLSYKVCDPTRVDNDLIAGGIDPDTETATGVYAVKYLYPLHNVYPMWLCAPSWSSNKKVLNAMYSAATKVNGHWDAFVVSDLPLVSTPFEDVDYTQYVNAAGSATGTNKIQYNLTNAGISYSDIDISKCKAYSQVNGAWSEIASAMYNVSKVTNANSTYATATVSISNGTATLFTANTIGAPEAVGYRLGFKYNPSAETNKFSLYKADKDTALTGTAAYWTSGTAEDKTAVIAAYDAAVEAGTIDDVITFASETSWTEISNLYTSITEITDGISAGDCIQYIFTSNMGNLKISFSGSDVLSNTRDTVISFMANSAWANERNKPCWPMAVNGDKVYNISTLYAAEALSLCVANNGIPGETPSNKSVPITGLYFDSYSTSAYGMEGANELNAAGIGTCAQWGGWRYWGNSTGAYSYDGDYTARARFDANMVTQLFLCNDFQVFTRDDIDRPLTMSKIKSIMTKYQTRLDAMGESCLYAKIQFVTDDNPTSDLREGNFVFQLQNTPAPPLNSVTVKVAYTDEGFSTLLSEVESNG